MAVKEKNNSEKDCLVTWKEDLKIATNAYAVQKAESDKAYSEFTNSTVWKAKLKMYWEHIQKTNDFGKKISSELELFKSHLDRVCVNTGCTVKALECLFCLIKDFFDCTDALKDELSELQKLIDCLNNPDLGPGTSIILGCLKDFSDKLDAAIAGQHELIKMVINVLKCARRLDESICSDDCGMRTQIDDLICLFETPDGSGGASSDEGHHDCDPNESCNAMLEPKPAMPLENDTYYTNTRDQYGKATTETDELEKEYNKERMKTKALHSYMVSLMDAIKAAEAAKDCK